MDEDGEPPDVCHLCNREQAPRGGVPSLAKTLLMCENAFSDPPTCDLEAHPFCVGLDQLPGDDEPWYAAHAYAAVATAAAAVTTMRVWQGVGMGECVA